MLRIVSLAAVIHHPNLTGCQHTALKNRSRDAGCIQMKLGTVLRNVAYNAVISSVLLPKIKDTIGLCRALTCLRKLT